MNNVWSQSGSSYRLSEISHQKSNLPVGIYRLEFNEIMGFFYLDHVADQFSFPYKIYGVETSFVNRVVKTWNNTTGNMGVLLNGLKGTGKTVTAELICNDMQIPVILVQKHYPGLVSFLNSIQQDVIIFIDEYEKIYNKYENTLLSVMDGAFKTVSRKMFLLTTNELTIEQNMLQRPSRIRYIKGYTDLSLEVIMEVVDDLLIHPHLRECTITMISELPIITMDLVKAIIEEVNIHEEDPKLFRDYFNVEGDKADQYNIYELNGTGEKQLFREKVAIHPSFLSAYYEQEMLYFNGQPFGTLEKYVSKSQIIVKPIGDVRLDDDNNAVVSQDLKTFFLESAVKTHRAFSSSAF